MYINTTYIYAKRTHIHTHIGVDNAHTNTHIYTHTHIHTHIGVPIPGRAVSEDRDLQLVQGAPEQVPSR